MATAGLATEADVGAEAVQQPAVSAARVAPPEADDIAKEQHEDGGI
jgi:hypothetical protein